MSISQSNSSPGRHDVCTAVITPFAADLRTGCHPTISRGRREPPQTRRKPAARQISGALAVVVGHHFFACQRRKTPQSRKNRADQAKRTKTVNSLASIAAHTSRIALARPDRRPVLIRRPHRAVSSAISRPLSSDRIVVYRGEGVVEREPVFVQIQSVVWKSGHCPFLFFSFPFRQAFFPNCFEKKRKNGPVVNVARTIVPVGESAIDADDASRSYQSVRMIPW